MQSALLNGANIFLAGDNYNNLTLIKTLLCDAGYGSIETFSNGNELLLHLDRQKPDIVISDVCMPQVDGFQLLREFKSNDDAAVSSTPVILCSATFNDFETRRLANELGAEAFFTIPFDAKDFLAAVEKALTRRLHVPPKKAAEGSETENIKLVILEDDKFSSRFLLHALKDLKYEMFTAETIAEFNRIFDEHRPQICIIDYNLPDGDGIDVLKTVKSLDQNTKVIMMTAITNERMIDDFIKEGADNFINKPINIRNLINAIKNAVEGLPRGSAGQTSDSAGGDEFGRDFSADYSDYFINAPLALAIIDEKLNCLRQNFEFDMLFKSCASNLRQADDNGAINLELILNADETENLKTVLNEMKRKDAKTKRRFTFSGGCELKHTMIIKSASNSDIVKNNYIYYIAMPGCENYL
ncbi:MAG: hypothetical protein A2008_09455 [Candidatus Wallbacteria bacterium GWC2_49_35]|uniref:Response regulatory domain-containing protein n=1 Tax=Candidatus Wallbacteria bacterium GWC2_49_35 TaxID=1817813 RepID=A0A1F7WID4_9BACT|nr:MAG: hypothetical protein A2008_09455 [Candidatus Wallbacteria bacterium GWC2_49_35]HBC75400.1 hypothetical protein [Candidatus Wallbacteria bacterium]